MDDKSYQVIFRGKTLSDVDDDRVKDNLSKLFKRDRSSIESLFDGSRKVLKRGLDRETANKYRDVLRKAGALVAVVAEKSEKPEVASSRKATFVTTDESPQDSPRSHTAEQHVQQTSNIPEEQSVTAVSSDTESAPADTAAIVEDVASPSDDEDMSLAPPGAVLIKREAVPEPVIPDNNLMLDEVGIVMDEVEAESEPDIDISQLNMSADFDGLDEAPKPAAPDINPEFDLSGEGVVLDQVAPAEKLVVATEHLSVDSDFDGLDDTEKPATPEINTDNLGLLE